MISIGYREFPIWSQMIHVVKLDIRVGRVDTCFREGMNGMSAAGSSGVYNRELKRGAKIS
jgi:hypothetical protein